MICRAPGAEVIGVEGGDLVKLGSPSYARVNKNKDQEDLQDL